MLGLENKTNFVNFKVGSTAEGGSGEGAADLNRSCILFVLQQDGTLVTSYVYRFKSGMVVGSRYFSV